MADSHSPDIAGQGAWSDDGGHRRNREPMVRSVAMLLALIWTSPVTTETVEVRDRGEIDLSAFDCTDTPRSTVVQRVCYDQMQRHLLVNIGGGYSEYCRLSAATYEAFVTAPSMGQFYRQRIAKSAAQYACDTPN
jgi:hypothetical protein